MTEKNTLDMIDLTAQLQLRENININTRTIYLNTGVSIKTTDKFLRSLNFLESLSSDPINVVVNSSGGDVYSGLAIIDAIQTSRCNITTVGTGLIASIAVPIVASGYVRKATRNAVFMFHEISSNAPMERLTTAQLELKHTKFLNDRMNKVMADTTTKSVKFWGKVGKYLDYYFTSLEARELGVIDELL